MKKRIGLGTWSWGNKLFWNYQFTNDDDLRETYNEALRRGFDLIDTADSYGTGNLQGRSCLLYTSPSPRDGTSSRMPSSA